ncbi:MAG: histidinol-phosphatase [Chloroflexi bacterium]|nr:histidinol-phosphatase [Chloroflexota bacterium]MBU1750883.1 histidinol-phosphatase [Chloroflexota bacterium]
MFDYHIHPSHSIDTDGRATIADYTRRALELGLTEICFTTHYDLDPARRDVEGWMMVDGRLMPSPSALDSYVDDVLAAREWGLPHGLWVGLGLEVDYFPGVADLIAETLARRPFDFIIGSVHCLDHQCLSAPAEAPGCFAHRSLHQMAQRYFDLVGEAAASGLFDVIGHLDIYKLYGRAAYGDAVLTVHRELAGPALAILVEHGVGLEINIGALRKGLPEPYPGAELLAQARSAGVHVLTVGSDAHCAGDLGRDWPAALAHARGAGFEAVHTFRRRHVSGAWSLIDEPETQVGSKRY